MDYDPAIVSDILDFLFLPNFGLDLDILKVEMGGESKFFFCGTHARARERERDGGGAGLGDASPMQHP